MCVTQGHEKPDKKWLTGGFSEEEEQEMHEDDNLGDDVEGGVKWCGQSREAMILCHRASIADEAATSVVGHVFRRCRAAGGRGAGGIFVERGVYIYINGAVY